MVGPLTPKSSGGHSYILSTIDYLFKWAEAIVFQEVKKETVVNFIKRNIIFKYGVPCYIITYSRKEFYNKSMDKLCNDFGFK